MRTAGNVAITEICFECKMLYVCLGEKLKLYVEGKI